MFYIWKKELKAYFYSPIGYVFIAIYMFVTGVFFYISNLQLASADFVQVLEALTLMFIVTVPVLTMRLLSEERRSKTDQLLLTAPIKLTAIVLGKYFAALTVFLITIFCTFIYPAIIGVLGELDMAVVIAGYVGFFLMGSVMIAIGVFLSSVTTSQLTAAIATLAAIFSIYILDSIIAGMSDSWFSSVLRSISVFSRFNDFTMGIIGLSPIIYFISMSLIFVFLTIRVIEKRRWSE
ncbi:MAG TPA: ABC transporter permease subunit [Clostridia bacterium]|nr:ABC transporter permease subunit [Clostridia bacterium]